MAVGSDGTRFVGTVKSWKDRWGFVVSDGVEGDVMMHVRENPSLGGGVQVGEQVEFELTAGKDGGAHAINATRPSAATTSIDENYLSGTLASFRDGWGLIESPSLVDKLYCGLRDNPQIRDQGLLPGDEVMFEMGINEQNGKHKAVNTHLLVREQSECVGRRIHGVVQRFNDGWGFATSERFRGTIMLGKKNVSAAGLGMHLRVGSPVEFDVASAPNGKHEAVNLSSPTGARYVPQQPMMRQQGPPTVPRFPAYPQAAAFPPPPAYPHPFQVGGYAVNGGARDRSRTPRAGGAGRLTGCVKTFRGSWGFITSDHVDGDIYVSAKDNLDVPLQPGDVVEFELASRPGSHNGSHAVNVWKVGGGNCPPPPAGPPPQEYVQAYGAYAPRVPPAFGKGKGGGQPKGAGQRVIHGKMLAAKDGWGWIQSPSVAGDIFLGLRDNPQLSELPGVGDELSFEIDVDPKSGRNKAVSVTPSMSGYRVRGTVTDSKGGWGFASAEGVDGVVMLGKRNCSSAGIPELTVGDVLDFDLQSGNRGYEAVNISWPVSSQ